MLTRGQTKPGRQIPSFGERTCVADRGKESGRVNHADAGDTAEASRLLIGACQVGKLLIIGYDPLAHGRCFFAGIIDQPAGSTAYGQLVHPDLSQATHQDEAALRQNDATLQKHRA
jgi:hypothetical protein